jgi:hypothetical protein
LAGAFVERRSVENTECDDQENNTRRGEADGLQFKGKRATEGQQCGLWHG